MHDDVREVLKRWLGADVPAVDALPERDLAQLLDAVTTARDAQAKALARASEEAMRQLPARLRNSVRRILGR